MKFLKLLSEMRDFCYIRAEKKHGTDYAEKEHKFDLKVLFAPYFVALLTTLAILIYKLNITIKITDNRIFQVVIIMVPAVIIYNIIFNFLYSKLDRMPIDKHIDKNKYDTLSSKSILILVIGLALIGLIPWTLDIII